MKLIITSILLAAAAFAAEFWDEKDSGQWSEKEVERILSRSPWAKQVNASMDFSRMRGGPPGGMPGGMGPGGPGGMGPGGPGGGMGPGGMPGGGPPGGMPEIKGTIRWESAQPVREAAKVPLPAESQQAYVISLSGMPVMDRGNGAPADRRKEMLERLKESATLGAKGKNQVHPFRVHTDEQTGVLYFFFTKAGDIDPSMKEVTFTAQLGPLEFKAKFAPKEMKYKGQPAM